MFGDDPFVDHYYVFLYLFDISHEVIIPDHLIDKEIDCVSEITDIYY